MAAKKHILFVLVSGLFTLITGSDLSVKTDQGELVGEWRESFKGKRYRAFERIPYAQPPIGDLRFREPQPAAAWNGVRDATNIGEMCPQMVDLSKTVLLFFGSEDCLHVNIYTPSPANDANLPVVALIHGGGYMISGPSPDICEYLMNINVICVTFAFRMGILGFLSTEDHILPGNNGLKDQSMALRWIKNNIKAFGGNPNLITVFGSSTGSTAGNLHLISPLSKGLFEHIVLEGGLICGAGFIQKGPQKDKAEIIAENLGCTTDNTPAMIDCLRTVPLEDLQQTIKLFMPFVNIPYGPFGPVVEPPGTKGAFLDKCPIGAMSRGEYEDIPTIIGTSMNEGVYPTGAIFQDDDHISDFESRWEELAPHLLVYYNTVSRSKHAEVANKIKDEYLGGKPVSYNTMQGLVNAVSDRYFNIGIEQCAHEMARHSTNPVYLFRFLYHGVGGLGNWVSAGKMDLPGQHYDASSNIVKVDGLINTDPYHDEKSTKIIEDMLNMVYEFATTGKAKMGTADWKPLDRDSDKLNILNIGEPGSYKMTNENLSINSDFWKSVD